MKFAPLLLSSAFSRAAFASRLSALLLAVLVPAVGLHAQSNYSTLYTFTTIAGRAAVGTADGAGNAAQFNYPRGVAVDGAGTVYVADSSNYTIRKITASGVVTTFAGSAGSSGSINGTGTAAQFSYPSGGAVDNAGSIYVEDLIANTIRKITSAGVVTTLAGTAGVSGSTDGTGSAAQFNQPVGVAVDAPGNVYVADSANKLIRKITPVGTVTTRAGDPTILGDYIADGIGSAAHIRNPYGVAVDQSGTLFVTDIDSRTIRKGVESPLITITGQTISQSVAVGGSVTLSVSVSSSSAVTYQWQKNLVNIPGAINSSIAIVGAVLGDIGSYRVVVTNSVGLVVSGTAALLTVAAPTPPVIATQPSKQTLTAGNPVIFTAVASGVPTPAFQWKKNNVDISGATGSSYTIASVGLGDAASYTVVATNNLGSSTSQTAALVVRSDNQTLTTSIPAGLNPGAMAVNPTTNKIYIINESANAYTPSHSVTVIDGATFATSTVEVGDAPYAIALNPVTNKIYVAAIGRFSNGTVTVIDGATNLTATLIVGYSPKNIAVNPVTNKIYVANESSFNVMVIDGETNAITPVAIGFSPNAIGINSVTNKIYVAGGSTVAVINGATNAITTKPAGSQPVAIAVNSVTNKVYVANYSSNNVTVIDGTTNTTTTVAVGYSPRCIGVNEITNVVYVVSNPATAIDGATNVPTSLTAPSSDGSSYVLAVDSNVNCAYIAYSFRDSVTKIEGGTNATSTVTVGRTPYAVAVNLATSTLYVANRDDGTVSVITWLVPPAIITSPIGKTVAVGSTATLTVTASGTPAPTFQWKKEGVNISGAISSGYSIASTVTGDSGSYTVVVSNEGGSLTSNPVALEVTSLPVYNTQPLSGAVFVGATTNFTGGADSNTAATYQWQKNGINILGATGQTLTINNTQLTDAGSYALIATNLAGSTTSRFARLVVLLPQQNAITYATTVSPSGVTAGGIVNFDYFVTNVGTKAWGTHHYLSIRDVNNTFIAFSPLIGILPGETTTANLNFPAPTTPGSYIYYVQGLEDGIEFFSTQTTVVLTVLAPVANAITYNTTSFPVSAAPGSKVIFTYNVTNTGTATWGANHILSLKNGSGTVISSTPLTVLTPGASKTVNLSFTVPSTPGSYRFTVQASQTGVGNFGTQADLTLVALAPQPNAIIYNRVRYPDEVVPGAVFNLKYTLNNVGMQAWGTSHYVSLRDASNVYLAFVPLSGTATGAAKTVEFTLSAPTTPGTYTYYVQALEDGIEFFSTQDVVVLRVSALRLGNAITYNASTIPLTAIPSATVNFTADVTNRGTRTWGAAYYLSFRDVDNTFLAFPTLNGVAPGASNSSNLSFTAPTIPGIYTYTLQAFEDGVSFFEMADTVVLLVQ